MFPFLNLVQFVLTAFPLLALNQLLSPITSPKSPSSAFVSFQTMLSVTRRVPLVPCRLSPRLCCHDAPHHTGLIPPALQDNGRDKNHMLRGNYPISTSATPFPYFSHSRCLFFVIISLPISTYLTGEHRMKSSEHESVCFR